MEQATSLFEAVIVPHRSLSATGMGVLIGFVCAVSLFTSVMFWWLGAWPIAGFNGAEVALAIVLLRINARMGRAREMLLLAEGTLRVVRTSPSGAREERSLPTAWLNVVLHERNGRAPGLWLMGHGVREEVGTSLGEDEKRDLAQALKAALHRMRSPVFDNPHLPPLEG